MFTAEDLDLLNTITNQSAIALENAKLFKEHLEKGRMEEELKIARDIQMSMLPEKAPKIEGLTIAARSIPAREVGGDFYDFIEITENGSKRLGIVVGDVSGKAVSGALVMAASRSIFRVLTETHESVEEVMNRGNARLHQDVKKGMFVALLYAVMDPQRMTLIFSNAGQVQPVIFSRDQSKPTYIESEGDRFPLGIVRECHYQETYLPIKPGDIIVFYTDGMVEAVNDKDELYGFDRFLTSIEEGRELSASALLEKLIGDVMRYVGDVEQHDDLTAVVVTVE
jgi:serine phosphatase RsbU (regulator of sigma subunit)